MSKASSYILFAFLLLMSSSVLEIDGECTYCVANPDASIDLIQAKLDFCCGSLPQKCDLIKPGGPCYVPNDLRATASYVFNSYFLKGAECDFDGAETRTLNDPSHGDCKFQCR